LNIVAAPTAGSIQPALAYAGSTITVTGANFILGFACSAKVGATPSTGTDAPSCNVTSDTTAVVVVASSTPSAAYAGLASSVRLTFTNGAKVAEVAGSTLNIVAAPTIVSIFPSQAYISSAVTLLGSNFISGSQSCSAKFGISPCFGTSLAYCHISSDSQVIVIISDFNFAIDSVDVCVSFSNPASLFTSSVGNLLSISRSPSITSTKPVQGYISSTITVFGSNFLMNNYSCVMVVGAIQSSFCRIASTSSVTFTVPTGSLVGSKVLYLNFNMGGSGATAVAPGAIFNVASSPTIILISPSPSYSTSRVTVTVSYDLYSILYILYYLKHFFGSHVFVLVRAGHSFSSARLLLYSNS
jgi:hypothetical protein